MNQITLPLATLPLTITCISDGSIALAPSQQFKTIIDGDVKLDMLGFSVAGEDYFYNTAIEYQKDTNLLKWLQSLEMPMPTFQQQGFPNGFPSGFNFSF